MKFKKEFFSKVFIINITLNYKLFFSLRSLNTVLIYLISWKVKYWKWKMSVKIWKQNSTVGSTWDVIERKCSITTESRKIGDDKSKFAGRNCQQDIRKFIISNDVRWKFYAGIDSYEKIFAFFRFYQGNCAFAPKPHSLQVWTHFQQFVLTVVKLRFNLRLQDLSYRLKISNSTASKYVHTWVSGMHQVLVPAFLLWPGERQITATLPMICGEHFQRF